MIELETITNLLIVLVILAFATELYRVLRRFIS